MTTVYPRYTLPERILLGTVQIIAWPLKMIKACLDKLSENDDNDFI